MNKALLTFSILALSACTVGPDFASHTPIEPHEIRQDKTGSVSFAEKTANQWWRNFDDPRLNQLIETGLKDNPDIRIAAARMSEARALTGEARAGLLPQIGTNVQKQRGRSSANRLGAFPGEPNFTDWEYQVGFDASWEIDLFGGRRRALEAAHAQVLASQGLLNATQITIAAEIGRSYVALRTLEKRLEVAHNRKNALAKTVELTGRLVDLGSAYPSAKQQATAAFLSAQAITRDLEAAITQQRHALTVLTARQPDALDEVLNADAAKIPQIAVSLEIAYPANALKVRPDIFAAEQNLAAATAGIGVAIAQLYPRISLLGSLNFIATDTDTLLDRRSISGGFGPQVSLPVFAGGAIRAQIEAAGARAEQALAEFDKTVLEALLEIHDGLAALKAAAAKEDDLNGAAQNAEEAASAIEKRYRHGAETLLNVLAIKQNTFDAQDSAAMARAEASLAAIALYKATAGAPLNPDREKSR